MKMHKGSRFTAMLGLITIAACDNTPNVAGLSCGQTASVTPSVATIHVADTLRISASADGGCRSPLLRNDTPAVIRLDAIATGTFRVTGLSVGTGQVRVLSPSDTTVSATAAITVTP
jgi:hypothetical protein